MRGRSDRGGIWASLAVGGAHRTFFVFASHLSVSSIVVEFGGLAKANESD